MAAAAHVVLSTRVSDITVIFASPRSSEAKAVRLIVGNEQHKLFCEANGILRATFTTPIVLSQADHVRLAVSYRPWYKPNNTISLDTKVLLTSERQGHQRRELQITQDGTSIVFGVCPEVQPEQKPEDDPTNVPDGGPNRESTANNGKDPTDLPSVSTHYRPGEANIETELTSPENTLFVLHDSKGFEPGEDTNYETAKRFILSRRYGALKDRTSCRLYDEFVSDVEMNMSDQGLEDEELAESAASKAESILNEHYVQSIHPLAGETLPHVAVSTEEGYENTLPKLVQLTYSMVSQWVAHEPSVVSNMAQRVNPALKIQGTIDIGKKRYWTALRSSPNFAGHTVWECLYVIHTDIVRVWNFQTPHLLSKEFRELMVKMVEDLHVPSAPNPASILTLSGGSLVAAISAVLGALANPAAPIVIPIVAGLALGSWAYCVYCQSHVVQQRFIAFIVDLTHIMETLFIHHGRQTREGGPPCNQVGIQRL
ncbi:hypothetical protein EDD16DRAFT_1528512 [Pisolithus croceorrhizus]|nr:hypothetical protein EDD16DRAFT_1528512 [Pisolithus croceorrhizus]